MPAREAVRNGHHAAPWPDREGCHRGFDIRVASDRHRYHLHPETWSCVLDRAQEHSGKRRRLRIVDDRDAADARIDLLEELQPFTANLALEVGEASMVAARPR